MSDYLMELPGVARGLGAQGETTDAHYVTWAHDEIVSLRAAMRGLLAEFPSMLHTKAQTDALAAARHALSKASS